MNARDIIYADAALAASAVFQEAKHCDDLTGVKVLVARREGWPACPEQLGELLGRRPTAAELQAWEEVFYDELGVLLARDNARKIMERSPRSATEETGEAWCPRCGHVVTDVLVYADGDRDVYCAVCGRPIFIIRDGGRMYELEW